MNSEEIIKQLNELSFISNELEVAESDRLRMIKTVSDYANKFLSGLDDLKVFSERKPG